MKALAHYLARIGWLLVVLTTIHVGADISKPDAHAATLQVANNGTDSGTCGATADPCRSISQAIANASAGDTIEVGPGHYGDLNGNGIFGESGEEPAEVGFGCVCMIKVDKQLTLVSLDGAATTVLNAGEAGVRVAHIEASGVVFGQTKHGFTLTGTVAASVGLSVDSATSGVAITGNVASKRVQGFTVAAGGTGHTIIGNLANNNSFNGFVIGGTGHVITGNTASANGAAGFFLGGTGHVVTGNAA
ncbi:MAG: NosD domain-containing protein, partial [Gammaproteobacteria bacterium]